MTQETPTAAATDDAVPHCWTCNYNLSGIDSARCPECGQPFDPADPRTFNAARRIGPLARRALRPPGRLVTAAAALAAGLAWATVRRPFDDTWQWSLADVRYYLRAWEWRTRTPGPSVIDWAYSAALLLALLAAGWWLLRLAAFAVAVRRYRPPADRRGRVARPTLLLALLLLATLVAAGVGWPHRLGQRWVREYADRTPTGLLMFFPSFALGAADAKLSDDDWTRLLCQTLYRGDDARQRTAALKILVERMPPGVAVDLLQKAADHEADPEVAATAIRLAGVYRDEQALPFLRRHLAGPKRLTRAAAADALGILANATFPVYPDHGLRDARGAPIPRQTRTDPPITLPPPIVPYETQVDLGPETLAALRRMMLGNVTPAEREAAARALLALPVPPSLAADPPPPPRPRLRYAEWGVFLGDAPGKLRFTRAQLDEIPPFVHRVGNPAKELEARIWTSRPNFKPVIHITASEPTVVRLYVTIRSGRPWVAYPKFDDLVAFPHFGGFEPFAPGCDDQEPLIVPRSPTLLDLSPDLAVKFDLREGYPWLTPAHAGIDAGTVPDLSRLGAIGVSWQSLIVTPTRQSWMRPAPVPADPKFAWWSRLRDVESSWVSSRGESERFLFYDGPSVRPAPLKLTLAGDRLAWQILDRGDIGRAACYVQVPADHSPARALWLEPDILDQDGHVDLAAPARAAVPITPADLLARLTDRGLTPSEAAGMLHCWQTPFLQTPGRRLLLFMTQADYDQACPMHMLPQPSESVRVGIVLYELP